MASIITTPLFDHLQGETTTLCVCCRVMRKDGAVFAFTNHTKDIVIDGVRYRAGSGMTPSALETTRDSAVDNAEISWIFVDEQINEQEMRAGLFDGAHVYFFLTNYEAPGSGILKGPKGNLGQVKIREDGTCSIELRSLSQKLTQEVGDLTSELCRCIRLGDDVPFRPKCKYNLSTNTEEGLPSFTNAFVTAVVSRRQFTSNLTSTTANRYGMSLGYSWEEATFARDLNASNTQAYNTAPIESFDGNRFQLVVNENITTGLVAGDTGTIRSVRFSDSVEVLWPFVVTSVRQEANDAWTFLVQSAFWGTVPPSDSNSYPEHYFRNGVMKWLTGRNAGREVEVMAFVDDTFILQEIMPFDIEEADSFIAEVGCDRTREMCRSRFNNVINFQAEPDIQPLSRILEIERV